MPKIPNARLHLCLGLSLGLRLYIPLCSFQSHDAVICIIERPAERWNEEKENKKIKRVPYSTRFINLLLTRPLTTPPTPKAGTILPILAKLLTIQSRPILATLCLHPSQPARLYRSNPNRWTGVLTSCIAAGARNCAILVLLAALSRDFENDGRWGAIMGGRLKDANTVRLSRKANKVYEIFGIVAAGPAPEPKSRAYCESLYTQRDMLTMLVARNFAGPLVVVSGGLALTVEERVSMVFAVK